MPERKTINVDPDVWEALEDWKEVIRKRDRRKISASELLRQVIPALGTITEQPAAAPSTAGQGTPASDSELANAITGLIYAWSERGPLWKTLSATLAEKAQQGHVHEKTASKSHLDQGKAQSPASHPKRARTA